MANNPTHTFAQEELKIRFKEPYASNSLNEQDLSIPQGVYYGFTPIVAPPSPILTLQPDSTIGASVLKAFDVESSTMLTVVVKNNITLDFTGQISFPVYVIVKLNYENNQTTTGQIITQSAAPNGIDEIGICQVTGPEVSLAVITTEPSRTLPIASAGKAQAFMPGGAVESLNALLVSPVAHQSNHNQGGSDPLKLDDLAEPDDNTTLNATVLRHGLLPKLSGNALHFLNGNGDFIVPSTVGNSIDPTIRTSAFTAIADGRIYLLNYSGGTFDVNLPASAGVPDNSTIRLLVITPGVGGSALINAIVGERIKTPFTTLQSAFMFHERSHFYVEMVLDKSGSFPNPTWVCKFYDSPFTVETHALTHVLGGSDPIKLDDLATPDDNTDLNASTLRHGLLPKLSGNIAHFLRGDGIFTNPPAAAIPFHLNAEANSFTDATVTAVNAGGAKTIDWTVLTTNNPLFDVTGLDVSKWRLDGSGGFIVPTAAPTNIYEISVNCLVGVNGGNTARMLLLINGSPVSRIDVSPEVGGGTTFSGGLVLSKVVELNAGDIVSVDIEPRGSTPGGSISIGNNVLDHNLSIKNIL